MTTISIRIDEKLKKDAGKVFEKHGLDLSTAVRMFLSQSVVEKGIPFQPTHDEDKIKKKIAEWERGRNDLYKDGKQYTSAQEIFDDVLS